jgi:nucleoid DNA-binding protein
MATHSKIYAAVFKELCPKVKPGESEEKMKSVHAIVDTVFEQVKNVTLADGEVRLKHLGTMELIKGNGIKTTIALRPSMMLVAELNNKDRDRMPAHRFWSGEESAELMRLNSIRETEQLLGWEWVARCMSLKFSNYRTPKSCKERVARIREMEAENG